MINSAGEAASNTVNRTFNDLNDTAQKAIEQSKQTATATVSEMLETHNMLRADTTALFERLREANIMLQEVLSGAHENMSALENTLMLRVSEFVTAMNEVTGATGDATSRVETNIANFRDVTARVITDLGQLADQFDVHGRDLAKAAELIDHSNQRTEDSINERRVQLDSLVATLDIRTEDLDQRLKRFSGLLDESLEAASAARARSRPRGVGIERRGQPRDQRAVRARARTRRGRAPPHRRGDARVYEQTAGDTHAHVPRRQRALRRGGAGHEADGRRDAARARSHARRTAPRHLRAAAGDRRKRRANAPRHRRPDRGAGRAQPHRRPSRPQSRRGRAARVRRARSRARRRSRRPQRTSAAPDAAAHRRRQLRAGRPPRRTRRSLEAPTRERRRPARGWLTDLLNRASREEGEPERDSPRETAREPLRGPEERSPRHSIESLDSLSVDIARMIDHDAAADLWDRYKRGERNVFTRRLYTLQGQQAFDEIRKKYRADREFKQTVDRYIGEFERLLDEVSRDDRGQVVARTYLTSETGKVYTMLAHAAGRFD